MQVQLLDVTLRDGGYRNNFSFSMRFASELLGKLSNAGINYVEVGYCNGSLIRNKNHGLTSRINGAFLDKILEAQGSSRSKAEICVMVHPHNVTATEISELVQHGASLIRVCLRDTHLNEGLETIRQAHDLGAIVSANIIRATEIPLSIILKMACEAENAGANMICVADSNGSMIPLDVTRVIGAISSELDVQIGFHAHNHLTLALANSIAAINSGANFIDASIGGMGKGAGNLNIAAFVAYSERTGLSHDYDLVGILEATTFGMNEIKEVNESHPLLDIMLGAYNLSVDIKRDISDGIEDINKFKEIRRILAMRQALNANHSVNRTSTE